MIEKRIVALIEEGIQLLLSRDLDTAYEKVTRAKNMANHEQLPAKEVQGLLLLGKIFQVKSEYSGKKNYGVSAIDYLFDSLKLNEKVNNLPLKIEALIAIGDAYLSQNKTTEVLHKFKEAIAEAEILGDQKYFIKCWNAFSRYHNKKYEFQSALLYAEKALSAAKELGEVPLLIESYRSLGLVYSRQHVFTKILPIYEVVLKFSKETGDIESEVIALNNLAIAYASKSEFKLALENFLASLEKGQEVNFHPNSSRCLVNIGAIFTQLENYEVAIGHYEKVLNEYQEVISLNTKAVLMINMGEIYMKQNKNEEAFATFRKCLEFAKSENYKEFSCLANHHLCEISFNSKEYEQALQYGMDAKNQYDDLGNINGRGNNLIALSKCYLKLNRSQDAIHFAEKGIRFAQEHDDRMGLSDGYKVLSEIYKELGDLESAFDCLHRYTELRDFIFEKKSNQALIDMEIKYETREKEKEIDLLKSVNRYQSLLLEKREQFETQNKQLVQANEELKQFTYAVSHDLREPIRMIESYTQILERGYGETWDKDQREFFDFIADGAQRMRLLLNDLLEFATIGGNSARLEVVEIEKVVEHIKQDLKLKIEESQAKVVCKSLPTLVSQSNLLRLVLQNLISNAIKFRDKEDPIVTITGEESDKMYSISVSDNGIGIASEHQKNIFKIFQRIHAKGQYEGTGIGLALCKKIVQLMNGEISLNSEPGNGTTFTITIPKVNASEKQFAA